MRFLRQVGGDGIQIPLVRRGECGIEALLELLVREAPLRVVLTEKTGRPLALRIPDPQVRS